MVVLQEKIVIPAQRAALADLRGQLQDMCLQKGVRPNTVRRLVLAVDEAACNVMEHSDVESGSSIEVGLEIHDGSIVAQIQDSGREFDPSRKRPTTAVNIPGKKRGFGLYLIHLISDRVEYLRTDGGHNLLTLTFNAR